MSTTDITLAGLRDTIEQNDIVLIDFCAHPGVSEKGHDVSLLSVSKAL